MYLLIQFSYNEVYVITNTCVVNVLFLITLVTNNDISNIKGGGTNEMNMGKYSFVRLCSLIHFEYFLHGAVIANEV